MEPKSELLVFSKKEVTIIITLLVLVALFSFTLGLKLGKILAITPQATSDHAPLGEHAVAPKEHVAEHDDSHAVTGDAKKEKHDDDHAVASSEKSDEQELLPREIREKQAQKAKELQKIEDQIDAEFSAEAGKEKLGLEKPVSMSFPKDKKGQGLGGVRFTLQVGSHRTVAEAAEQVTSLKRSDLDAFYLEAKVPGKGTWYRVGIGLFSTKEIAEKTAEKWKTSKTLPPFIVQKIDDAAAGT